MKTPSTHPSPSLATELRSLPRPVWVLAIGVFINRFGSFVIPFLTLYMTKSGYSPGDIWKTFAALAAGGMTSAILGGWLADRIGRKNTMSIALISAAASILALWQADNLTSYVIAAFCVGLSHGAYHPAASSLLADLVPPERRVIAFGLSRFAINLGFGGGMAAGGFLAEISYDLLFVGDALTTGIYGAISFFLLPHGLKGVSGKASGWMPALISIWGNKAFVAMFFSSLFGVFLFFHWGGAIALLIKDLGYPERVYGMLMAFNGFLIVAVELPLSHWVKRFNARRVIGVGFFLCGLGVALCGFATGWIWLGVALIIFTVGEMISMPVSGAYISELAPEDMRGRYNGVIGLTWHFGHAVAPGLGLLLYQTNPAALWWGSLGCGAASLFIITLTKRAA
ncbi:MAG: MFS transporter [Verrucomicrobiales bacterium]|nr:MFS transporter [Verrucomicrobiales bacterium]